MLTYFCNLQVQKIDLSYSPDYVYTYTVIYTLNSLSLHVFFVDVFRVQNIFQGPVIGTEALFFRDVYELATA